MGDLGSWSQELHYLAVAFGFAYLLGSIPFGLVLTKIAGVGDVRDIGSGSIGATNVLRTGHKGLAVATLLLDAAKGLIAVIVGQSFGPDLAVIAAWGAVLGHLFPVWLKFSGGKGFATALGVLIGLAPLVCLFACLTWLAVAISLRYSSLATLVAMAAVPFFAWYMGLPEVAVASTPLAVLIWLRHHGNLRRLLTGTESKIKLTVP